MEISQSKTFASFPIWSGGKLKKYYYLERQPSTKFKLVYYENNVYKDEEKIVAVFEGHMVEEPDLYRFVDADPLASLHLSSVDRVAIEEALSILNSEEEVIEISGGALR